MHFPLYCFTCISKVVVRSIFVNIQFEIFYFHYDVFFVPMGYLELHLFILNMGILLFGGFI